MVFKLQSYQVFLAFSIVSGSGTDSVTIAVEASIQYLCLCCEFSLFPIHGYKEWLFRGYGG
jgi:hypothetical protein